jgi:cytoskeleton protein RodZ
MESIGEKLSRRREEQHYSVDQAARETHIAKLFIEALESENFEVFPGESYLIGFLRKYSDYLELDAEEMITLYRNTQIQEQPSPMDELLDSKPKTRVGAIIGIAAAAIVVITGVILLIVLGDDAGPTAAVEPESAESSAARTVVFSAEIIEQEFAAQTSILVPLDEEDYRIELRDISNPLNLFVGDESFTLEEGASGFLDLNQDDNPDLRIVFKDSLANGNPVLRLDKVVAGAFAESNPQSASQENDGGIALGSTSEATREKPVQTILSAESPEPYFIEAIFRGPVLFRYLDEAGQQVEQFYNSGERFQIEVNEYIYFWLSNAGKVQMTVAGQNVLLGRDGEVTAVKLAWNGTQLELVPMY